MMAGDHMSTWLLFKFPIPVRLCKPAKRRLLLCILLMPKSKAIWTDLSHFRLEAAPHEKHIGGKHHQAAKSHLQCRKNHATCKTQQIVNIVSKRIKCHKSACFIMFYLHVISTCPVSDHVLSVICRSKVGMFDHSETCGKGPSATIWINTEHSGTALWRVRSQPWIAPSFCRAEPLRHAHVRPRHTHPFQKHLPG